MALPTYLVEIQFGSSSYIDVSAYVQNVSFDRGISRQLDDYSAGTLSITFVNNSRVFDPTNTGSILWYSAGGYSVVQPGGRVRVSANGVRRFTGFIQDWAFSYDSAGLDGHATLIALDELYRVGSVTFTGGTAWAVEPTSDRINTVMNYNGFGASEYAGVQGAQTMIGYSVWSAGDSVLSYLQNVARSEPGDFYSNASAVIQFKDRSFTNYVWNNTLRQNLIKYPNALTADTTTPSVAGGTGLGNGWVYGYVAGTATPYFAGGTVNTAYKGAASTDFWYQEVYKQKINPNGTATSYVYSVWLRGNGLTGAGVTSGFSLLDDQANVLTTSSVSISAAAATTWVNVQGTATYGGTSVVNGFYWNVSAPGTTNSYSFVGNGWQVEAGSVIADYFDGSYNSNVDSAMTRYRVGWAGVPYASESGLLTGNASAISALTINTFADANSQGASYGNGTGIPFTDLGLAYGSENLYNKVQVVGVNATATVEDTTLQSRYGTKVYSQYDNLTSSLTRPADIAASLLGEFRLPEYRAERITVALEALTVAQQNIVTAIDLRDVIRVCFQPSQTGTVVDKYYQVLSINSQTDVERDHVTFTLGSLDNFPIRLDSTFLSVLDTDTLG